MKKFPICRRGRADMMGGVEAKREREREREREWANLKGG